MSDSDARSKTTTPQSEGMKLQDKVRQLLYGGDAYDATEVFNDAEFRRAKRMLGDHVRPDGDDEVVRRAERAIEQIEEVL